METAKKMEEADLHKKGFQTQFEDRWSVVSYHPGKKIVVCQLKPDYVPIEHFRSIFLKISELVKNGDFTKFIFDKRSLRTFHQPSMEWYFIEWKQEMAVYGLTRHRKILPDLEWFKTAVAIERNKLLEKLPSALAAKLDIKYCESIGEAIDT